MNGFIVKSCGRLSANCDQLSSAAVVAEPQSTIEMLRREMSRQLHVAIGDTCAQHRASKARFRVPPPASRCWRLAEGKSGWHRCAELHPNWAPLTRKIQCRKDWTSTANGASVSP